MSEATPPSTVQPRHVPPPPPPKPRVPGTQSSSALKQPGLLSRSSDGKPYLGSMSSRYLSSVTSGQLSPSACAPPLSPPTTPFPPQVATANVSATESAATTAAAAAATTTTTTSAKSSNPSASQTSSVSPSLERPPKEPEEGVKGADASLHAGDVVANGKTPNSLQMPSPVYCVEWVDANHVLIGAGGGGRRFGMANVAVLLRVSSHLRPAIANGKEGTGNRAPNGTAASSNTDEPLWSYIDALDLGGDIPWCSTAFLPVESSSLEDVNHPEAIQWSVKQREVLGGIAGFIAISSITSFSLVGLYRNDATSSGRYRLCCLARIEVPNDPRNPDKKPIALVRNMIIVAHDEQGALLFPLTHLVPEEMDREASPPVPIVRRQSSAVAAWSLGARVNDLHANRVRIVQAKKKSKKMEEGQQSGSPLREVTQRGQGSTKEPDGSTDADVFSTPCTALVHDYVIIAALLQNKTMSLVPFRLRRNYSTSFPTKEPDGSEKDALGPPQRMLSSTPPIPDSATVVLSGKDLPLTFPLMSSSLRLVRLFGWENVSPAHQPLLMRQMTWHSLQTGGAPTNGSLCRLLLVAYDMSANQSFFVEGVLTIGTATEELSAAPKERKKDRSMSGIRLRLSFPPAHPTPVLQDAITSLSAYSDCLSRSAQREEQFRTMGTAIPPDWVVGTVEGWVASVHRQGDTQQWEVLQVRPSSRKSVAKRYPALHKEPVSSVAVSAGNDVVSADIAQNVILTTLPCVEQRRMTNQVKGADAYEFVTQPRHTDSVPLFPPLRDSRKGNGILSKLCRFETPQHLFFFLLLPCMIAFAALLFFLLY